MTTFTSEPDSEFIIEGGLVDENEEQLKAERLAKRKDAEKIKSLF